MVGEASLETRRSLRRRLDNLEAVAFAVPTEDAGVEAGEGGLTGAEYAATMINQIADPVRLTNWPLASLEIPVAGTWVSRVRRRFDLFSLGR